LAGFELMIDSPIISPTRYQLSPFLFIFIIIIIIEMLNVRQKETTAQYKHISRFITKGQPL